MKSLDVQLCKGAENLIKKEIVLDRKSKIIQIKKLGQRQISARDIKQRSKQKKVNCKKINK